MDESRNTRFLLFLQHFIFSHGYLSRNLWFLPYQGSLWLPRSGFSVFPLNLRTMVFLVKTWTFDTLALNWRIFKASRRDLTAQIFFSSSSTGNGLLFAQFSVCGSPPLALEALLIHMPFERLRIQSRSYAADSLKTAFLFLEITLSFNNQPLWTTPTLPSDTFIKIKIIQNSLGV